MLKLVAAGGGVGVGVGPPGVGSSPFPQLARHPVQAAANPIPKVLKNSDLSMRFMLGLMNIILIYKV
jgi:hypothetical protein